MYSKLPIILLAAVLLVQCTAVRRVSRLTAAADGLSMTLPGDEEMEEKREEIIKKVVTDSTVKGDPLIMNAIRDEETGEMVATDVITASKVTARFRHVAERFGKVAIEFDINVPASLMDSKWQLRFFPEMILQRDTSSMEPIYITGSRYRNAQLRGYQRYAAFLSSIITDTTDFVYLHLLEVFLERNYPETYAMKTDSTLVAEPEAENLFGVTQRQALEHYKKTLLMRRNDRRIRRRGTMYAKYVKDPIVKDGIRLDTVIAAPDGSLVYRYVQEVDSRPGLRRITVSIDGDVYDYGKKICALPRPDSLVFYVSSLSTLADQTERYMTRVVERNAYDKTLALIDFSVGKSVIDTSLGCNAGELVRMRRGVDEVLGNEAFELDSLILTASCSPEGAFQKNASLAKSRASSLRRFLGLDDLVRNAKVMDRSIPENWELLEKLVEADREIADSRKSALLALIRGNQTPDVKEAKLSKMPEYRYLREKLYPRLRTVQMEFYTHRAGMIKDTIHTTELDTVYMAGLEALRNLDYKGAVERLRPYRDYNAALALVSMSYNHTALDVLDGLTRHGLDGGDSAEAKVLYLKALVLARLERWAEALDCFRRSVELDPSMVHRANLDPELSELKRLNFD